MSRQLEGRTALVTGGSAGLGIDFADQLARRGADVIVVARRKERLQKVADDLEDDYGVETDWVAMDLATLDAGDELYDEVTDRGWQVDILVNNAGFGVYGEFLESDWDAQEPMLTLDMITPVRLAHLFGADMVDRGWGRMMQVASIGAYQPSPRYATYSATKSFLRSWGEAFDLELRRDRGDVTSTVVCPGVTETEFFDSAGQESRTWFQKLTIMDSSDVAEIGVDAMLDQRMTVVPGWLNAVSMWLTRFVPRLLLRRIADFTMQGGKDDSTSDDDGDGADGDVDSSTDEPDDERRQASVAE